MLTVSTWKWRPNTPSGPHFGPEYVNRLRAGLERHLHIEHELVCITDEPEGIDPRVRIVPMPEQFSDTPRCRRRMRTFSREWVLENVGARVLRLDLDIVIVDDITPLVDRPEPLVCWRVGYADVFSGSVLLLDGGVLDNLWRAFARDPWGFPRIVQPYGTPSDQAMLNWYLRGKSVALWTDEDGIRPFFGRGYERFVKAGGIGPETEELPAGTRIVVLGSSDKDVMDEGRLPWVREHWRE